MKTLVHCTHCQAPYQVDESLLGQKGKCKKCGRSFPMSATVGAIADQEAAALGTDAGQKSSPTVGSPRTASRRVEGDKIGRFEIRGFLGSGGFGEVYRAFDTLLKRDIALKLPHPGLLTSEADRARLMREPQVAAQLRHPNIVPIYDAGEESGQFYIAAAFIDGRTLKDRLDEEQRPDFRQAAKLVISLADALDYAHCEGIVHRDVKPANIMLDGKGEPLLMDFGLARLREAEDRLTHEGTILGTPAYMSPEQAAGKGDEIAPTSDQYSLGVVLYELLCGERPFEGPAAAVVALVISQEPKSPKVHKPEVPKDLDTICLKAMAKRREERYANCERLAADLRRWLDNEPIRARRAGAAERFIRWCRREPVVAGLTAATFLIFLAGFVVSMWQWRRADIAAEQERAALVDLEQRNAALETERNRAIAETKARKEAVVRLSREVYAVKMQKLQEEEELGRYSVVERLLDELRTDADLSELRDWEWHFLRRPNPQPGITINLGPIGYSSDWHPVISWHPDGSKLVTSSVRAIAWNPQEAPPPTVKCWNTATGQLLKALPSSAEQVTFDPSGRRIAGILDKRSVAIWDFESDVRLQTLGPTRHPIFRLSWSRDGTRLAACGCTLTKSAPSAYDGEITVWTTDSANVIWTRERAGSGMTSAAWGPDDRLIAVSLVGDWQRADFRPEIVDAKTGTTETRLEGSTSLSWIYWNQTGESLFGHNNGIGDHGIQVWESVSGKKVRTLGLSTGSMSWDETSRSLAAPSREQIMIWQAGDARLLSVLKCGDRKFNYPIAAAWDPEGRRIAVAENDPVGSLKIWNVNSLKPFLQRWDVHGPETTAKSLAWIANSSTLISGGTDGSIYALDLLTGMKMTDRGSSAVEVRTVSCSPKEDQFLVVRSNGRLEVWEIEKGKISKLVECPETDCTAAVWTSDGRVILKGSAAGELKSWRPIGGSVETLDTLPGQKITAIAVSQDGALVAIGFATGSVRVFSQNDPKERAELGKHDASVNALAFDGRNDVLASAGEDRLVKTWDLHTKRSVATLSGHHSGVTGVSWNPTGTRIVSVDAAGELRIWDPISATFVFRRKVSGLPREDYLLSNVAWSTDGRHIATCGRDFYFREGHGVVNIFSAELPEE